MVNGQDDIIWNGASLLELMKSLGCELYINKLPAINKPARKQTKYSIGGRSGTVVDAQDAWDNVVISYEITIAEGDPNTIAGAIAEWLYSTDGYAKLSDSFDNTHYRLGYIDKDFSVENLMQEHARTKISFNCRPERFLFMGSHTTVTTEYATGGYYGYKTGSFVESANYKYYLCKGLDTSLRYWVVVHRAEDSNPAGSVVVNEYSSSNAFIRNRFHKAFDYVSDKDERFEIGFLTRGSGGELGISFNTRSVETVYLMAEDVSVNPTNHVAKPIITFESVGVPSLMMMTGRTDAAMLSFAADRWLLSRKKIAWTWSGVSLMKYADTDNAIIFGEDPDVPTSYTSNEGGIAVTNELGAGSGDNIATCMNRSVKANTKYYFHCSYKTDASADNRTSTIYICETDADGYPLKWHISENDASTGVHTLYFRTTANTYWIVVCFCAPNEENKTHTYTKIQLNAGSVSDYVAYGTTNASAAIVINDIKVGVSKITSGLTIDCESENVYCNDENCNDITAVRQQDESGTVWNYSDDFPSLSPGDNTITYAGDMLTRINIEPRFWEF